MCTLKEIWDFILDYKTSSAITFFSLLFAVFVWLLTNRHRGKDSKAGTKRHRELRELLEEIKGQIETKNVSDNLNEDVKAVKEKAMLIATKMYFDLKNQGIHKEKLDEKTIETAAQTYLILKSKGVIKENLTEILFITMTAVLSKVSAWSLSPISIETDGVISGRAVFTSNEADANKRMRLFAQMVKEIEQASRDVGKVEVTDKFINIIIFKDCKLKFPQLAEDIADNQCNQYFYKWCEQLQVKNITLIASRGTMKIVINHPHEPAHYFNEAFVKTFSYLNDYIDYLIKSEQIVNPSLFQKHVNVIRDFVSDSHNTLRQQIQDEPNATSITITINANRGVSYKNDLKSALSSIINGPNFEYAAKTYINLLIDAL